MRGTRPVPGAVYDLGNALGLFWPDIHPCGPIRREPWLVLTPDGGSQWVHIMRPGARYLGMLPGMVHDDPPPSASSHHAPTLRGVMLPSGGVIGAVLVEPKPIGRQSWLNEPRYHRFVQAYQYAASHFSVCADAFAKLTPEEVYLVVNCVEKGFDAGDREEVGARSAEVTSPRVTG